MLTTTVQTADGTQPDNSFFCGQNGCHSARNLVYWRTCTCIFR